jgi:endonuclease/exonuclease/phosphatase family metal-dependent hydrolase
MNGKRLAPIFGLSLLATVASTALAQTNPSPPPPLTKPAPPSSASSITAPPSAVTAAFWNIQWFPGRRPNASRAEEARQIRAVQSDIANLKSDVIGIEEVRDSEKAALAVQPLAGFKVDVCSNFPAREGQNEAQQVAIASRLVPLSAWAEAWKPGAAITPPRGFAFAAYQVAPKQLLLVYALHLKSNRGEIREDMLIREESMRQLLSHMKTMNDAYGKLGMLTWIVGGDFNTAPDDPRFRGEKTIADLQTDGFAWAWQGIPLSARITVPPDARYPGACFDQIFYRGGNLLKAWMTNTSPASSDHRAINAVINLAVPR